jgi:outer membrane protein OmpA-like peptidoglycan-associated protein
VTTNVVVATGTSVDTTATITAATAETNSVNNSDSETTAVEAVNDSPVNAMPGNQVTAEETPVAFAVSISDPDAGGAAVRTQLTVTNGTLTLNTTLGLTFTVGDGTTDSTMTFQGTITAINTAMASITYVPATNFAGNATFTVVTNDLGNTGSGGAQSDTDNVTISVSGVNDGPINTVPGAQTAAEDTPKTLAVSIADVDAAGNPVQIQLTVTNGTLSMGTAGLTFQVGDGTGDPAITATGTVAAINTALGSLTYTPTLDFTGTATFSITTDDQGNTGAGGNLTDSDNVSINVVAGNDPPNAVNDVRTVQEDSIGTLMNPLGNDTTAPDIGETLTITAVTQPANGSAAIVSAGANVSFTPAANFNGATSFTYTVNDGNGGTDTATISVTVNPVNDPPDAINDVRTIAEDSGTATITVLANDTITPDTGETLTVLSVTQPANGTSAVGAGGANVTFTPNANFNGVTSFSYTISDGNGGSDTASVSVTVTAVNDAPNAVDDTRTVAEDSAPTAINVLANDSIAPDIGETLTIVSATQPAGGTVVITGAGNGLTFQPTAAFNGVTTFTYTISDGNGGNDTATVTVTVSGANDPPTSDDDTATVAEDSSANIINVLGNDTIAPDVGETLTVLSVTQPANGTAAVGTGGANVTFTPAANFNGTTNFNYTVSDGNGGTDTANVVVTVTAVNDPPDARDDLTKVGEDAAATPLDVLANDTFAPDVGETLTIVAVTQPAEGVVAITGGGTGLTFDPNNDFIGIATFTYTINDGNGGSDTATVQVGIGGDTDGDFLPDEYEVEIGTSPTDADSDDDGVRDGSEAKHAEDTDADGAINALDPDSDNDGLYDGTETGVTVAGGGTDPSKEHFLADADPATKTDPLDADSDDGGVIDGSEDANRNGRVDSGETNPNNGADDVGVVDTDGDGLSDLLEATLATNSNDADTDDDGVIDGDEPNFADDTDGDNLINAKDPDSDGDFLKDGTELGITEPDDDTNVGAGNFVADADPANTTSAIDRDSDDGGVIDGDEDANHDGRVDDGERDPNNPADDDQTVGPVDDDGDGVRDDRDNCPGVANPDQADTDNDDDGDACDADANGGGLNDDLSASGGGCSTGGDAGGALVLMLGVAWFLRKKRGALVFAAALALVPNLASAQNTGDETRDFSVERFQLASDRNGVLGVEWAESRGYLAFDVALWLGYANDPLVVSANDERVGSLVSNRTTGGLVASISPASYVTLGLEMPVVLSQDRAKDMDVGVLTTLKAGSGSLRLIPKLTIMNQKDSGIGIAVVPAILLPTQSSDKDYLADDGVSFAPEVDISKSIDKVRIAFNVGYHLRPKTTMLDLTVDDEIFVRAGFGYRMKPVGFDVAVSTAVAAKDPFGRSNAGHLEALAGANVSLGNAILFAAGGVGLNEGFGTPDYRLLAGVRLGAKDRVEIVKPPEQRPEEIDTDGDTVMDWRDNCKEEAEDMDGFEDANGCPDLDNDKDTVPDTTDKCRDEAGVIENNGCPALDADVDGVMDHQDKCPAEAEDHDNYQDDDGCPESDNDADGISDPQDACPTSNGPPENGGCPDADRDGDGMVDRLDNCPDEKGEQLNAGCTTKQLVAITPVKLATREQVEYNRGAIAPKSNKLLDNIAAVLVAQPTLIVEIGVHTDDAGDDAANKTLTQKRADAVGAYLVKKGVDASRLIAIGYGEEQPEGDNKTKAGRAQNKRTVFKIVSGRAAPASAPKP